MTESVGTVTCMRCGGAVTLAALATSVTCPYCKTHVELAPHEVERLVRYRNEVRGRLEGAREQLGHAESWNRWYGGPDAKRKNNPLIALALWGSMVVLMAGVGYAAQVLDLEPESAARLMPVAMFGVVFLVFGGYLVWFYAGRRSSVRAPQLANASMSCPRCGAPNLLQPGEALEHCRFCSAALLANTRVMEHGRAEAERAFVMAEIERARAERRAMAALSSSSAANMTPYIILGSFLPMTLLGAVAFTISFLRGREPDTAAAGILLIWALAAANAGLIGLVYVYRRHRRRQIDRVLHAMLQRFGGAPLADHWAATAWLDRHWAGAVPMQQLFRGPYFAAISFEVQGYPVLIVANPVGVSEHYPGFVSVRLGAWLSTPEEAQRRDVFEQAKAAFGGLGFTLELERAGPVALVMHGAARRFIASADSTRLADAVVGLAHATRELGAEPVDIA